MEKILILLRDDEDSEFIYGGIIIKDNVFDIKLFQNRLDEMRQEMGYEEYNGDDIAKAVLNKYPEYKNIEYIFNARESFYI